MRPHVLQLTPESTGNPFYTDTADELRRRGWHVEFSVDPDIIRQRARQRGRNLVVHIHQLEPFYAHSDRSQSLSRLESFEVLLDELEAHGVALVHTMHNRRRHDGRDLDLDDRIVHSVGRRAVAVIILTEAARTVAESRFPPAKIHVVPHPNFRGRYGPIVDQVTARTDLAIPADDLVFLMLGSLRPYKQHVRAMRAFGRAGVENARMMIVGGRPPDADYVEELERAAADELPRGRVRVVAGVVEDDDIPVWLGAANASLHAYDEIFASSSVMLALSYGIPVVAPQIGSIPEVVIDGYTGRLWHLGDEYSLAAAIRRMSMVEAPPREDVAATVAHLSVAHAADRLAHVYITETGGRE